MNKEILRLVAYALSHQFITKEDVYYTINQLLDILHLDEFKETSFPMEILDTPIDIINTMIDDLIDREIIKDTPRNKKIYQLKILNCILPKPSTLITTFYDLYDTSSKKATDFYYRYALSSLMIKPNELKRKGSFQTTFGSFDLILDSNKYSMTHLHSYPKCPICKENEGYRDKLNHRYIPIRFNKETYHLEYIQQAYIPQQFYLSHEKHVSCNMDRKTFEHVLDFVHQFPHYFITCESPSRTSFDHAYYMGGMMITRLEKSRIERYYTLQDFEDVEVGKVFYPTTVLRLRSKVRQRLVDLADKIYLTWKEYSDPSISLLAYNDKDSFNTLQVVSRKLEDYYELDLIFRSEQDLFEPQNKALFKRLNILHSLGIFVINSKQLEEIEDCKDILLEGGNFFDQVSTRKYASWVESWYYKYKAINQRTISGIFEKELGYAYIKALHDSDPFKKESDLNRFLEILNYK